MRRSRLSSHSQPRSLLTLRCRADDDLNIPAEGIEEAIETFNREPIQSPSHQGGDLRLIHAHDFCRLGLGELTVFDNAADLDCQIRLGQQVVGAREAEVCKEVSA